MADCRSNYSYVCFQYHEHLGADIVNSVHDHWRGFDTRFDLLHDFNVLGASSFCDDAGDLRVLVCVRSSVQGAVMREEAEEVTVVSR